MPAHIPFSKINHTNIIPLVEKALQEYNTGITKLTKTHHKKHSFDSLMLELEVLYYQFGKFWSSISHLNDVKKNPAYSEAFEKASELVTNHSSQFFQNKKLYKAIKHLKKSKAFKGYNTEQQALINEYLQEFELNGIQLKSTDAKKLKAINEQLNKLQEAFERNHTASINAWTKLVESVELLDGLPQSTIAKARENAKAKGLEGYLIDLSPGMTQDIMRFAKNRSLRREMYEARKHVASHLAANPEHDNSAKMVEILKLRQEKAELLGFKDFVDLSLSKKMAKRDQVNELFVTMSHEIRPQAQKEYERLQQFAKEYCGIEHLETYDISFVEAKLKEEGFSVDDKLVKEYFPAEHVLDSMFEIVKELYGLDIKEEHDFDTWDPDVKLFSVYSETGDKMGEIYMDLYARNGEKRSGAWMNECEHRLKTNNFENLPIAFLNTNFTKGTQGKPSLLSHREVQTTFHEFGHCLHHVLSTVPYPSIAGPSGVPWDAVEAPSQMMENWIWDPDNLKRLSKHYQTNEPLPDPLIQAMAKLRNFNSGLGELRQLCFSIFDFKLHGLKSNLTAEDIQSVWLATHNAINVYKTDDDNYFPNGFGHIFAGEYSAGYYSYNWALNIAHNMFNAFKEQGIMSKKLGRTYSQKILSPGGSKPFMKLVEDFIGKTPDPKALAAALKEDVVPVKVKPRTPVAPPQQASLKEKALQYGKIAIFPALLFVATIGALSFLGGLSLLTASLVALMVGGASYGLSLHREKTKNSALKTFAQSATITPEEKDSFKLGLLAGTSYVAQAKSCFQWNAYKKSTAYYAGLKAEEVGLGAEFKQKLSM